MCVVLLVRAAEAVALTQGDVGLVHRLDVRLCRRDDVLARLVAAHSPPGRSGKTENKH